MSTGVAVDGEAGPADRVGWSYEITTGKGFFKPGQVSVIMGAVFDVADPDPPAAIAVPALGFHNAEAGAAHSHAVRCEQVRPFMDTCPAPASACPPGAAVGISFPDRQRKSTARSIKPSDMLIHPGNLPYPLRAPPIMVIFPSTTLQLPGDAPLFHPLPCHHVEHTRTLHL
ncbi:hypothetical protein AMQ83_13230, partial [Paenibacillus riograndensis]